MNEETLFQTLNPLFDLIISPETDKYNQSDKKSQHRHATTNLTHIIQNNMRIGVRDILLRNLHNKGRVENCENWCKENMNSKGKF